MKVCLRPLQEGLQPDKKSTQIVDFSVMLMIFHRAEGPFAGVSRDAAALRLKIHTYPVCMREYSAIVPCS